MRYKHVTYLNHFTNLDKQEIESELFLVLLNLYVFW